MHSNQQGLHVPVITEILTGQLAEPLLLCRLRVLVSHACDSAAPKIADKARRIIRGGQASRGTPDGAGKYDESRQQQKTSYHFESPKALSRLGIPPAANLRA